MKMLVLTASLFCALAGTAFAAGEPTEKDAIAMVERGAAVLKAHGKEALMKQIMAKDSDYVQGSLYLYVRDLKTGVLLAHPVNPTIIGKDLTEVPDAAGKPYRLEIMELARKKGVGWVDYQYRNPANGKVEPKTTYIMRVADVILEAGVYKK